MFLLLTFCSLNMKINIKNTTILFISLFTMLCTSQQAFARDKFKCHIQSPKKACGEITSKDIDIELKSYERYIEIDCPNGNGYFLKEMIYYDSRLTFETIDDNSQIANDNKDRFKFNIQCSKIE